LVSEFVEFLAEGGDFGAEFGDGLFHVVAPVGGGGLVGGEMGGGGLCGGIAEEVDEGGDAVAVAGGKFLDELTGREADQFVEGGLHVVEGIEGEDAFGAGAELAESLAAAEEEDGEEGGAGVVEIGIDAVEGVLEFGDPGAGHGNEEGEAVGAEAGDGFLDQGFIVVDDGIAVCFLAAGRDEGIHGERVLLGGGGGFLEKAAEDADFLGSEGP